jgi:myosin heavy subunit
MSSKKTSNKKKSAPASRMNLDSISGGKDNNVSIYFDPRIVIGANIVDEDWIGDHLFIPATVVKVDEENGILHVKIPDGNVYKIPQESAVHVNPQDNIGIDDILKLHIFSEMSLVQTLRVRYELEDIYTFVGPILISINPYKWIENIYAEETMAYYHGKRQV